MNLVFDIGNSSIKTAVFKGDRLMKFSMLGKYSRISEIKKIVEDYPGIRACIGSSVAGDVSKLALLIPQGVRYVNYSPKLKLPLKNLYCTPGTLGSDRIAAAVAANAKYRNSNVLVIDAGTCVTFDLVNNKNEYLGGSIAPGLEMRFKALNHYTTRLPLVRRKEKVSLTGKTTEESILSGVVNGMCAELNGMIEKYASSYKSLKIIFTGGDAPFLTNRLSGKNHIFADPYLVLRGLNRILSCNVKSGKKVN